MTRLLFGTDGVRGKAGEFLTGELALALGQAATHRCGGGRPQVLIVRDTRESGEMLQAALAAGVTAAAGDALLGGVLPTPAAPLLLKRYGFDLAVVISASHNPYFDNGIKFFASDGYKLSDQDELEIEAELSRAGVAVDGLLGDADRTGGPAGEEPRGEQGGAAARAGAGAQRFGRIRELRGAHEDYLRELHTRFSELDLAGMRVLLDCANGATYRVAPEIFRRLGAQVSARAVSPDGRNINENCGSTHVASLARDLAADAYDIGFAFDGDGDRVLAVDRTGAVVDGDELMALAALHLRERNGARDDGVVVTVMTNYGFHVAMSEAGIDVACTSVGDRYVLEELRKRNWSFGGEQSGHIIDMSFNSTGDGIAGALLTLEALAGRDLSERDAMHRLPQRLVNVPVRDRAALASAAAVTEAIRAEDEALSGRGRVLVRPSGTEPLVRVMVEAPTDEEAQRTCERLVALVRSELG